MKLSVARTTAEVLDVLARRAWHTAHDGAECPPARIPALKDLAAWQSKWPADVTAECARLLTALLPPSQFNIPVVMDMDFKWELFDGNSDSVAAVADGSGLNSSGIKHTFSLLIPLNEVHIAWCALPEPRPSHPLAPLVAAWQRLAEVPATARVLVERASLARLSKLGADEATLPDFPQREVPLANGQLLFDLPDFGPLVRCCPSWLLWLFDRAGGQSLSAGHGAPWDLALFVFALLHLDVADRDGTWHTLEVATLADDAKRMQDATGRPWPSAEAWLFGDSGWAKPAPRLGQAAGGAGTHDEARIPANPRHWARRRAVPVRDPVGTVRPADPIYHPHTQGRRYRRPAGPAAADRVSPRLGATVPCLPRRRCMVRSLGEKRPPDHPDDCGAGARPNGKPRRRKGGAIIRSATERTLNSAERYVAPLSEVDLTRMIGFDPDDRNHPPLRSPCVRSDGGGRSDRDRTRRRRMESCSPARNW